MKLLSLLLLAVIASTVFVSGISTFAQETTPQNQTMNDDLAVDDSADTGTSDDTTTDEEMATDEETTTDDTNDETTDESEEYAATDVDSPLEQLMAGTDPHAIQCDVGLKLAFKATNFQPACLKESTYQILSQRGWVSNHDPTPEELSAMMSALPKPAEEEADDTMDTTPDDSTMDDTTDGSEMENSDDTGANSTSEDEPTPQSYQVNLSESMNMAAN